MKKKGRSVSGILERISRLTKGIVGRKLEFDMADFDFRTFDKKIPLFGGDCKEIDRFVTCCDAIYGSLSAQGKVDFGRNLIFKLTGSAFSMVRSSEATVWPTIKTNLEEKFGKKRSMAFTQKDLIELKQGHRETVAEFSIRIEECLDEMNRASTEIKVENEHAQAHFKLWHEKLALRAFQDGLREPLKLLIKARNYGTLREAINGAIEEETYLSKDINNLGESSSSDRFSRDHKREAAYRYRCLNCNEQGHWAQYCPQRRWNNNDAMDREDKWVLWKDNQRQTDTRTYDNDSRNRYNSNWNKNENTSQQALNLEQRGNYSNWNSNQQNNERWKRQQFYKDNNLGGRYERYGNTQNNSWRQGGADRKILWNRTNQDYDVNGKYYATEQPYCNRRNKWNNYQPKWSNPSTKWDQMDINTDLTWRDDELKTNKNRSNYDDLRTPVTENINWSTSNNCDEKSDEAKQEKQRIENQKNFEDLTTAFAKIQVD